ncbi:MAG TPA: SDR family oxidoreductase [Candidatus Hydrogenedentes bacterium]|nr:SDR family oxidoreductase [Candidatus Hydrogenedentota bacterium]
MRFRDKVIVVTGGAQGIGKATAMAFLRERAQVVVTDIDKIAGEELAHDIERAGASLRFMQADVGLENEVVALMNEIRADYGRVDVLINNAAVLVDPESLDNPTQLWDRVLAVNLRGPYLCVQNAAPMMPPGSAIVNISSTRALMSEPNTEPYSASKGGLLSLTHALAVTLSPQRIRVNAICPGWIETSRWKRRAVRHEPVLSEADHEQHPVGRVGMPEDVAEACLFLADTKASGFITGQHLIVDGGMTIKMIYA